LLAQLATVRLCSKDHLQSFLPHEKEEPAPWFTGTLLGTTSAVVPVGNLTVEPYLFTLDQFGQYGPHWRAHSTPTRIAVFPFLFAQIGLTKKIDFQITPELSYQKQEGKSSTHFADLPMGFDFQLANGKQNSWSPAVVFTLLERFPTGKYQKLNPDKHGVDSSGDGAYTTIGALVFSWLYHFKTIHFLHTYITLEYALSTSVHVKGFNTYGGGFGTKGRVKPGNFFSALLSLEYSLTRNWAFALDVASLYQNKTTFSGKPGVDANGNAAVVGSPSQAQISLAPAIEYNFSSSMGFIGGPWFSVAGRNAPQFAGAGIAFYYYYTLPKKKG
jgi:hypothetical protein